MCFFLRIWGQQMEITLVNEENRMYFEDIAPPGIWTKTDLVLGAMEQGQVCGLLMAEWLEEDILIVFLYVVPEFRRRKIATGLLDTLHLAARVGSRASIRCSYVQSDQQGLDHFFQYHCFVEEETNPLYRICYGALNKDLLCRQPQLHVYDRLIPLKGASASEWMGLVKWMTELRKYDVQGSFPQLSDRGRFHGAYSFLHLEDSRCVGCILIHEQDGCFVIDFLWSAMGRPPMDAVALLQAAYQAMSLECVESTLICVNALTKKSRKIVDYFAKDQEPAGMVITKSYIY